MGQLLIHVVPSERVYIHLKIHSELGNGACLLTGNQYVFVVTQYVHTCTALLSHIEGPSEHKSSKALQPQFTLSSTLSKQNTKLTQQKKQLHSSCDLSDQATC